MFCFEFIMMSVMICKKGECHHPRGINTKIPPEGDTIYFDQLILIRSYRLQIRLPIKNYNLKSLMPTTRKARKLRGLEIFSDLKNLDIMLGIRQSEREESENSNHAWRRESVNSNMFENTKESFYLNPKEAESGVNAELGQNSTSVFCSAEINRLSSEINSRISREMDEMMNSVSVQIQRAINDAISSQVLSQIQNVLMAGSGHMTQKGWNVPAEGLESSGDPDVLRSKFSGNNLKSERVRNRLIDEPIDKAYDMVTGENESTT